MLTSETVIAGRRVRRALGASDRELRASRQRLWITCAAALPLLAVLAVFSVIEVRAAAPRPAVAPAPVGTMQLSRALSALPGEAAAEVPASFGAPRPLAARAQSEAGQQLLRRLSGLVAVVAAFAAGLLTTMYWRTVDERRRSRALREDKRRHERELSAVMDRLDMALASANARAVQVRQLNVDLDEADMRITELEEHIDYLDARQREQAEMLAEPAGERARSLAGGSRLSHLLAISESDVDALRR